MSLQHVLEDPLVQELLASKTEQYALLTHLNNQLCMIGASKAYRHNIGFKASEELIVSRYGMAVYRALSDALKSAQGWSGCVKVQEDWYGLKLWAHGRYSLLQEYKLDRSLHPEHGCLSSRAHSKDTVAGIRAEDGLSTAVSGSVLLQLNNQGAVTRINTSLATFLGQPSEELQGVDAEHLVFRPDVGQFKRLFNAAKFTSDTMDGSFRLRNTANQVVHFDWTASNHASGVLLLGRASKIHLEEALIKSEERINRILESMDDAFFAVDEAGYISYVNEKGAELLGKPIPSLLGRQLWERAPHLKKTALYSQLNQSKGSKQPLQFQWEETENARWYQVKAYPSEDLISVFFTDISGIKRDESQMRHQAMHDSLTGLPNRLALTQSLHELIHNDQIMGFKMGLLFIDLDGFKTINDTLGHDCGDELLVAVAERLRAVVRSSDIVARLSGDEFVITLPYIQDSDTAYWVGKKVVDAISQKPFNLNGNRVYIGASVGLALFPNDSREVEGLLKNADIAMYQAKQSGKNTVRVFHQDMSSDLHARLNLENDLHDALLEDRLELVYQPRFDVSGNIRCLEALARLRSPTGEVIPPKEFIPVAEDTGLIVPMGEVILRKALMWVKATNAQLDKPVSVSINVSGIQLLTGALATNVDALLRELSVPAHWVELELTETVLMQNEEHVIEDLQALHRLGVKLSIDDFGTGFSSLAMLQRMPVQLIKLDRSFVKGLPTQYDSVVISRTVLALAKSMGMGVVAEGVETEEQRDFLIDAGFEELQGFGLARPMASEDAQHFVWAQEIGDSSVNDALGMSEDYAAVPSPDAKLGL